MDDAIRTAGRDLAFARAQCGPQATATFEVALRVARMSVAGAVALRQQLDEALSESEPRARADQVRAAGNIADASLGAPFEGLYAAGGSLGIEARPTGPHGSLAVTGIRHPAAHSASTGPRAQPRSTGLKGLHCELQSHHHHRGVFLSLIHI